MAAPTDPSTPRQHVVVVGADTTTVRLVEELTRGGDQLVVLAHGTPNQDAVAEIVALGAQVVEVHQLREEDLRRAGISQAKSVVILGDNDVLAVRIALMVEELAPGLRIVIEMTNPRLGGKLTELIGDCTLLSSAELAAPVFVAAAMATADTQTFEIGGRMVAAGARGRVGGEELAVIGDSRMSGIDAVCPVPTGTSCSAPSWSGRERASPVEAGSSGRWPGCSTGGPGSWSPGW